MANKKKLLLPLVALLTLGMSACGSTNDPSSSEIKDDQRYAIYLLAVDAGYNGTYEEWLASIKGEQGEKGEQGDKGDKGDQGLNGNDGNTPFIGSDGNWWIGDQNTGVRAGGVNGRDGNDGINGVNGKNGTDGKDGDTPFIGSDGNWWIGDQNTGVAAAGQDGQDAPVVTIGADGNWWIGDQNTGVKAAGSNGVDGQTPYVGSDGNWWIGEQNTGVPCTGPQGPKGDQGVSVVDVLVTTEYIDNVKYTVYTFKMSDGSEIVRYTPCNDDIDYVVTGIEDGHPVVTSMQPSKHSVDEFEIVLDDRVSPSVKIDDNTASYEAYMTVSTGTGASGFIWTNNLWQSNNKGVGSSTASITFTAVEAGTLYCSAFSSGEGKYDFASTAVTTGATLTPKGWTGAGTGTNATTKTQDLVVVMEAGSEFTYKFQKDTNGNYAEDCGRLSNMVFECDAIPYGVDDLHTVSFNTLGGSFIQPKVCLNNGTVEAPTSNPKLDGYVFDGWYADPLFKVPFNFSAPVCCDVTAYAKWAKPVLVTVHNNDGSLPTPYVIAKGASFTLPNPYRDDAEFLGFYTTEDFQDGTEWTGSDSVTSNFDIYVKWFVYPQGANIEEAYAVNGACDIPVKTTENAQYFYMKYTATRDEVVTFAFSDYVRDGGSTTYTSYAGFNVYDSTGEKVTLPSTSKSASSACKKIAHLTSESVSITFESGETYYVAFGGCATYTYYTSWGKAQLHITTDTEGTRPETAYDYQLESVATWTGHVNNIVFYKFSVPADGDYWVEAGKNLGAIGYSGIELGSYDAGTGTWTAIKNTGGSSSCNAPAGYPMGGVYSLLADKTYYVACSTNDDDMSAFKISATIPATVDAARAKDVTVDVDTPIEYYGPSYAYYKFTPSVSGTYGLTFSKSFSPSLYNDPDCAYSHSVTTSTLSTPAYSKYASLTAGQTYYLKLSVYSGDIGATFRFFLLAPGMCAEAAETVAWNDDAMTVKATADGYWSTYTPTASGKKNVIVPAGATVEVYKLSYGTASLVTTLNGGETTLLSETKNTAVYFKVMSDTLTEVNLTLAPYQGPLYGTGLVGKKFRGCSSGSSWYEIEFGEDSYIWDQGSTYDIDSCENLGNGMYKIIAGTANSNKHIIYTDGNEVWLSYNSSTTSSSQYYYISADLVNYSSAAISGQYAYTNPFSTTTGYALQSVKHNDGSRSYALFANGQVYFNVTVTFISGTDIKTNGNKYNVTFGSTTIGCTKGSSYMTVGDAF